VKKLYFVIVSIGVVIFFYYTVVTLISFSNKALVVTSDSINDTGFSSSGSFAFKSTQENATLLKPILTINLDFIKNPPLANPKPASSSIKNFYKLEKFFSNFKIYYITKLNLENILLNELPNLYTNTTSLSSAELETYFTNNKSYLQGKMGINDFETLSNIVTELKKINIEKITSYEVEDSYFFMKNLKTLTLRIIIHSENSSDAYIGVNISMDENSSDNLAPQIRLWGVPGGI